jgi:hypothetical protein
MIDAKYGLGVEVGVEELNAKREKDAKAQRREEKSIEDALSHKIIGAAIEVHSTLGGPGLLESIYIFFFFAPSCLFLSLRFTLHPLVST